MIMDFGLARESGDSHGLAESGAVMGTPAYMSPEQARGEARGDQRSDVYSLVRRCMTYFWESRRLKTRRC